MRVKWGIPQQLEDYGVLICLFAFHVGFGGLSVAVRIPVYDVDALTFLSMGIMVLVFYGLTVGARRSQQWLFMTTRYPLSMFEATVGVSNGTLSVVEWLVILLGQCSGLDLCWKRWLWFSADELSRHAALAEFSKPLSAVVVYTLIMSMALFNVNTSTEVVEGEPILFLSILVGVIATCNSHFALGTAHNAIFLGLAGIYRVAHHGVITLVMTTLLHSTLHTLYRLATGTQLK